MFRPDEDEGVTKREMEERLALKRACDPESKRDDALRAWALRAKEALGLGWGALVESEIEKRRALLSDLERTGVK